VSARIGPGARVRMHYRLSLPDGTVVESSAGREPLEFVAGSGELPAGLEELLMDLPAGARASFRVAALEERFGGHEADRVQEIPLADFPAEVTPVPGAVIAFQLPSGDTLPGLVHAVHGDCAEVDFNNPLIGRDFDYEVEILSVDAQ